MWEMMMRKRFSQEFQRIMGKTGAVVDSGCFRGQGWANIRAPAEEKDISPHFVVWKEPWGQFTVFCPLEGRPRGHFTTFVHWKAPFRTFYHVLSTSWAPVRAFYCVSSTGMALWGIQEGTLASKSIHPKTAHTLKCQLVLDVRVS